MASLLIAPPRPPLTTVPRHSPLSQISITPLPELSLPTIVTLAPAPSPPPARWRPATALTGLHSARQLWPLRVQGVSSTPPTMGPAFPHSPSIPATAH